MENRYCPKCDNSRSMNEFHKDSSKSSGLRSWCKICDSERAKSWRERTKEQRKEAQRKSKQLFPWRFTLYFIKDRCNNKNCDKYKYYGGRGIKCLITEKELMKLWFECCAWRLKKPSIDRKDNDGDYTYKNCRYIERGENTTEVNVRIKSKKIIQYSLNKEFIKEWINAREIERLTGFHQSHISDCANGKLKTSSGYIWKYKDQK